LRDLFCRRAEPVEPRHQRGMQRCRHRQRCPRNGRYLYPGLEDRFRQFFQEQRHAIGTLDDLVHHITRQRRGVADDPANQLVAFVSCQASQGQRGDMRLARPGRVKLRAKGRDQ
jgi:hypothetical protein